MSFDNNKCIDIFRSEYKISFMKKIPMFVCVYYSCIKCKGLWYSNGKIETSETEVEISFDKLVGLKSLTINNIDWLIIDYNYESHFSHKIYSVAFYYDSDINKIIQSIINAKNTYLDTLEKQKQAQLKFEQRGKERAVKIEKDASNFYNECINYHIKEQTPIFELFSEKNKIMVIYISENRSLNFLYLDGYKAIENHGIIPFEKIHYYDNAGDVHYVSEIQGNYSSFGGSFTGASFSKEISLIGGALFGLMGMATGAMLTYEPSKYEQPKTTFDINSETHRIDDRNVILNFYSDSKKQYVDLELPQTIYNFLQTYLPEKKYDIVMELEKNNLVKNKISALNSPADHPQLLSSENDPMAEFKKKVEKLKIMYEAGLLSDEELEKEKNKLLANL